MNDLKALYQEVILDHSKKPRNFHALDPCSHSAAGHNPLCGDNLKIFVRLEGERITEVSFVGDGCAISKASASLMTEMAKGKTLSDPQRSVRTKPALTQVLVHTVSPRRLRLPETWRGYWRGKRW